MDYLILDLLSDYETARRSSGYSPYTIDRVNRTMNMLCRDMNLHNLSDLTTESILEWGQLKLDGVLTPRVQQSGLYACYNSIRSFLVYLERRDVLHTVNRKLIHCKPNYSERECLRPEEIKRVALAARHYQINVLIRLLYSAGMRISEALNLSLDDLRADHSIHVNHSKWCESRTVFVSPSLYAELQRLGEEHGGHLFVELKDSTKPLKRDNAYIFIKKAMVAAGVPNAYPHSLRHGFATTLLREGAGLSHVRRLLGHKHITTTQIYEHLVTEDLRKTYDAFLVSI